MATLNIRVDDEVRDALDALAASRGVTVSEVIRESVAGTLGSSVPLAPQGSPRTLSVVERHRLALMHQTLATVMVDDEGEAEYHARMVEVLRQGYTMEYDDVFTWVYPEMTWAQCRLVRDILEMFDTLKISLARLDQDEIDGLGDYAVSRLTLGGFDGNDSVEGRMIGYVRHLFENGQWENLVADFKAADGGNSHMPMLGAYERMLAAYRPIREKWLEGLSTGARSSKYVLTPEDLATIRAAYAHPRS